MKKKERKKSIEKEERRDLSHIGQRWVKFDLVSNINIVTPNLNYV